MPSLDDVLDAAGDEVELDLSGAVEYDDVPNGKYVLELTKVEKTTKKNDKSVDVLKWYFNVDQTLKLADSDSKAPGRGSYAPIVTTRLDGPGAGRSKQIIVALGFGVDSDASTVKFSPGRAKGRKLIAVVRDQKSNPEYQEIADFEPYDDPEKPLG